MMKYFPKICFTLLLIISMVLFVRCYSFTGASIAPDIKTFSLSYFPNKAMIVSPTLSQEFTDKLRNYVLANARLHEVDQDGDVDISGEISGYDITPVAIQGNDKAALNRLTMRVNVRFINHKNEKENFTQTFSRYADYSSTDNFSSVESTLIEQITNDLILDIYNRAFANW